MAAIFAMGKPVAFDASAELRLTRRQQDALFDHFIHPGGGHFIAFQRKFGADVRQYHQFITTAVGQTTTSAPYARNTFCLSSLTLSGQTKMHL